MAGTIVLTENNSVSLTGVIYTQILLRLAALAEIKLSAYVSKKLADENSLCHIVDMLDLTDATEWSNDEVLLMYQAMRKVCAEIIRGDKSLSTNRAMIEGALLLESALEKIEKTRE